MKTPLATARRLTGPLLAALVGLLGTVQAGCSDDPTPPTAAELRAIAAGVGTVSLGDAPSADPAVYALGQALFFDPELSGNRDISCARCHVPSLASADFISLAIGTGGIGVGPNRVLPEGRRLYPRNTLDLFNRGYAEFTELGWDGAIRPRGDGNWTEPEDWEDTLMPDGLDSALAAQAIAALSDRDQMAGRRDDTDVDGNFNEIGGLEDEELPQLWQFVVDRVTAIDGYLPLLRAAYPDLEADAVDITHLANAIAAFEAEAFVSTGSAFDRFLSGDDDALGAAEIRGADVFFGAGDCASCHSGPHLTDHEYHDIAVPQVGLGQEDEEPMDYGRGRETNVPSDRYAFRTPALRNVTETGPWMHDGAYTDLELAVRHHLDCEGALRGYDSLQLKPELQHTFRNSDVQLQRILSRLDEWCLDPPNLSSGQVDDLMTFLGALTDLEWEPAALVPESVPSGRLPR